MRDCANGGLQAICCGCERAEDQVKPPRGSSGKVARGDLARIAFDSRPAANTRGVGRYARCLLGALRETAAEEVEIVETHRPAVSAKAGAPTVFHTPWMEGAILRSPCPMVVTLHDLDALTRRSERLRRGGIHARLRHLALQRATHVIVGSEEMAEEALATVALERGRIVVIPPAPHRTADSAWSWQDVARATWDVYERALREPPRPFVSRPRAASGRRGWS
jgi:hypothetical protein